MTARMDVHMPAKRTRIRFLFTGMGAGKGGRITWMIQMDASTATALFPIASTSTLLPVTPRRSHSCFTPIPLRFQRRSGWTVRWLWG